MRDTCCPGMGGGVSRDSEIRCLVSAAVTGVFTFPSHIWSNRKPVMRYYLPFSEQRK